jgi:large subunit ribosomal protein LP2
MKYIAAYALLVLGGKAQPSPADVEKLLKDSGIASDSERIGKLTTAVRDRPLHEVIAAGKGKMTVSAGPVAGAGGAGGKVEAKPEPKVEAKPVEEAADVDMGGLFGDEY